MAALTLSEHQVADAVAVGEQHPALDIEARGLGGDGTWTRAGQEGGGVD